MATIFNIKPTAYCLSCNTELTYPASVFLHRVMLDHYVFNYPAGFTKRHKTYAERYDRIMNGIEKFLQHVKD